MKHFARGRLQREANVRPNRIATERLKHHRVAGAGGGGGVRPNRIATERLKLSAVGASDQCGGGQTEPNRDRAIETSSRLRRPLPARTVRPNRIATERLKHPLGRPLRLQPEVRPNRIATERLKRCDLSGAEGEGDGVRPNRIATERLKHPSRPLDAPPPQMSDRTESRPSD